MDYVPHPGPQEATMTGRVVREERLYGGTRGSLSTVVTGGHGLDLHKLELRWLELRRLEVRIIAATRAMEELARAFNCVVYDEVSDFTRDAWDRLSVRDNMCNTIGVLRQPVGASPVWPYVRRRHHAHKAERPGRRDRNWRRKPEYG